MKIEQLELCFKGNRTYVHGTDIFNSCIKLLSELTGLPDSIDFSIHAIMRNQLCALGGTLPTPEEKFPAIFKFSKDGLSQTLYLRETTEGIKCRYDYDEASIIDAAIVDIGKQEIFFEGKKEFTTIEKVIALQKKMVSSLFPAVNGKWFFTRIKIIDLPFFVVNDNLPIRILLRRNLNFKLIDSIVEIGDKKVGNIYFSLV